MRNFKRWIFSKGPGLQNQNNVRKPLITLKAHAKQTKFCAVKNDLVIFNNTNNTLGLLPKISSI